MNAIQPDRIGLSSVDPVGVAQPPDAVRLGMGFAGEWLAYQWLTQRHGARFMPTAWISRNRRFLFSDDEGDDAKGFDFRIVTTETERLYEVKASLDESCEFELTQNEISVASMAEKDTVRRYRIPYVPFVFDPTRWKVLMLPNPMGQSTRNRFRTVEVRSDSDLLSEQLLPTEESNPRKLLPNDHRGRISCDATTALSAAATIPDRPRITAKVCADEIDPIASEAVCYADKEHALGPDRADE